MGIGFWQILILSGGFPIPLIVALVIFFKKRKPINKKNPRNFRSEGSEFV